mmetsp:Transcript_10294/g.22276  ORF Transcript_10294/g.22276 Transcript_10294/m.22276 type:complete len:80 (+) Transcript_10294:17-256(+)
MSKYFEIEYAHDEVLCVWLEAFKLPHLNLFATGNSSKNSQKLRWVLYQINSVPALLLKASTLGLQCVDLVTTRYLPIYG